MAKLTTLLARLPDHRREVRMSTYGHVLWVCWHGVVPPAVTQTLQNYGGMQVVSDHEQALWFFFTDDVFLALARLTVWSNFNSLPVTIELIPGRLVLDNKREILVNVDAALQAQEMVVSEKFEVWIHPKSREGKSVLLPERGPVENTVQDILGGVRSACTYVGARRLKELTMRTTFVRVSMQINEVFGKS